MLHPGNAGSYQANAMIRSSHRDRKTKAIAEVLAMIPDVYPELVPHRPRPVRETDEWLWDSGAEFCAGLDHYAGRTMEIRRAFAPAARRPRAQGGTHALRHWSMWAVGASC